MDERDKLAIERYRYPYNNLCRGRKKIIDQLLAIKKEEGKGKRNPSD